MKQSRINLAYLVSLLTGVVIFIGIFSVLAPSADAKKSTKQIKKNWQRVQICTIKGCDGPAKSCEINDNLVTTGHFRLFKSKKDSNKWGVYVKKVYDRKVYHKKWVVKNVTEKVARAKFAAKCKCENFTLKNGVKGSEATKCY